MIKPALYQVNTSWNANVRIINLSDVDSSCLEYFVLKGIAKMNKYPALI